MSKDRILVVEDDAGISTLVAYNLEKSGFEPITAAAGEQALDIMTRERFDLVILDIMLPEMDGFEVCRRIRRGTIQQNVPIIMLTAKGQEVDRIVGLELGADDYVVKPFSPRELMLRVKAILKRHRPDETQSQILTAGNLHVDIPKHRVRVNDETVELTHLEFKLLVTLMERRGRAQSRDILLEAVWGVTADVVTRTVDTHIKRLRQKLGPAGSFIDTVRGLGYRFDDEV